MFNIHYTCAKGILPPCKYRRNARSTRYMLPCNCRAMEALLTGWEWVSPPACQPPNAQKAFCHQASSGVADGTMPVALA